MESECDILVIGLGPAGMAVAAMADALGLKVTAIEKRKIGGECLNVGCIPSKAILKTAKMRHMVGLFKEMGLSAVEAPEAIDPFQRVRDVVQQVNEGKTTKMFKKLDLILAQGPARFVDSHTVEVEGVRKVRGKKIFICTGTSPNIPAIEGIDTVPILTNENLYDLKEIPESMIVIGGGAIGCEMGQALARLGASVTIINADECLLPRGDRDAGKTLCEAFTREGIEVHNGARVKAVSRSGEDISVSIENGPEIRGASLLLAAGRKIALDGLMLENAGVGFDSRKGIIVDSYLRTSQKHIFAVGDCNGYRLFTHAAMHQGMIALINALAPAPFRKRFKKYVVPWSVFTDPEVSQVGETEAELRARGVKYDVIESQYADYGRSTADGCETGFVKALVSRFGKIYGVTIVGEGSSEMIHEFGLAIQEGKRLSSILFLQHSFPTYSFVNKRIAEIWVMKWAAKPLIQKLAKRALTLGGK